LAIERVCSVLLDSRQLLTELDQRVGAGDLGISMSRGAQAILDEIDDYPSDALPASVLRELSATVRLVVGGTSGLLYAVMLLRAAAVLERDPTDWAAAFTAAVSAAERGAVATASMSPRLGRWSYLGDRVLGAVDPGAHAVALWLAAIRDAPAG